MMRFSLCLVLCVFLCALLAVPVQAEDVIRLTVWGSQGDQDILAALIGQYKKDHPDQLYDIALAAVEEPNLWDRYREDPKGVADIFAFVSDRLIGLVGEGVLLPVGESRGEVIAGNTPTSIDSATVDDTLYAYPMTGDNGYFLYYDSSVLTPEDVETLDDILAKAEASGKKVFMDISNGWYLASFFFGAGCSLDIDEAGYQVCDFNSDAGVLAGEAVRAFTAHPAFLAGNDATLVSGMGDTICAGVSGTWNAEAIRKKLGDNFRACKLPTYMLGGQQAQMGSFIGTKLMGVSALTAHPQEADELASYLNSGHAQILRFKVRAMGPSNVEAAAFPEVQENAALAALMEQNEHGVSSQKVLDSFWGPTEIFGEAMESQSVEDVRTLLNAMVGAIQGN